jgi:hypothetical protein
MPATLELVHLVILSFFVGCAYKALTGKVKQRLTTFLVSLTLALPFYFLLQGNSLSLAAPYYPWGAVLPLSVGVIEALRVRPKIRR